MCQPSDLMGLGMAPGSAAQLGFTPSAVTTTGTSSGGAYALDPSQDLISLTTASSQTGAILSTNTRLGDVIVVNNSTSTTGVIYPSSGATINAASSYNLVQNKTAIIVRYSTTLYFAILTA